MKPIKVKFHKSVPDKDSATGYSSQENEGHLIGFGVDASLAGQTWSTAIIILFDGRFENIPVENITLKEPFKEDDWEE